MSSQIATPKNQQTLELSSHFMSAGVNQDGRFKVIIPYDGSENAEAAFGDMRRAGLPQNLDALVAVTNVSLPLSPSEITRAVIARRMMVLTAGASSFAPALRDYEEQRVLSFEADRRMRSIFPLGIVKTEALQDVAAVTKEILLKAKTWGAELIIVGSRISPSAHITDYAGPALRVAQDAHCSVRIARASDREGDAPIQIMIGVAETDSAAGVVQAVADRFWPVATKASIVAFRKSGPRDPVRDSAATLMLERLAGKLRAKGLEVSSAIKHGQPEEVFLREAREISADCIFLDSDGSDHGLNDGFYGRSLGKVAAALVLAAHCSVEVVRPKNLTDEYLKPAA